MQIVTECEKTLMYKTTWRDANGEIQTDFTIMNNSDERLKEKDWKRAAEEIIRTTNQKNIIGIIETVQVKHNNIYIAIT